MAKSANQKRKLLVLSRLFLRETDEEHGLTMSEIIQKLAQQEIPADRKTLYQDFDELRLLGLDIVSGKEGRRTFYRLASREFELPELKLLVDSVQSSKFITQRKSMELIKKLESLASVYEAQKLQRQVILSGRVKNMNESIYYSVDKIHEAIGQDRQISFQYFQWNLKKEQEPRHDGARYHISPYALVWDDECYYLIGYDEASGIIKHFRVDKMLRLTIDKAVRSGKDQFKKINLPDYSRRLFGMFGGEPVTATLLCENNMAGPIIDRFGQEVNLVPVDENHFTVRVQVVDSNQFLGWIIALGGVKITAPESLVEKMQGISKRLAEEYL